jgi:antitoxin (DNA-binding transcriptional repressor) of toxin-antitoxin stability system
MHTVGIEVGRSTLPQLAQRAYAGEPSLLTKHGKPYAAIVPPQLLADAQVLERLRKPRFLSLRGSGKGLWGAQPAALIAALRDDN